jgi:carbon storage regulator
MLVLTRKPEQSITLGGDIRIHILSVEGDRVSIGVEAPKDVRIFRSELLEDTKQTNQEALSSTLAAIQNLRKK